MLRALRDPPAEGPKHDSMAKALMVRGHTGDGRTWHGLRERASRSVPVRARGWIEGGLGGFEEVRSPACCAVPGLLSSMSRGPSPSPLRAAPLAQISGPWSEFSAEGGPLEQLFTEQDGDLCGPRPVRPITEEGADLAELAGGGLMSGREILALLQGMSAMGVIS
jgi:hypothetical protein